MNRENSTLLLLSGGLDSALLLHRHAPEIAFCVGFDYGQQHKDELIFAERLALMYEKPFEIIQIPHVGKVNDVVFAARNAIFVSIAASQALSRGLDTVMIGCNWSDWLDFPDCRPVFWQNMRTAFRDAYSITLSTPLLHTEKADIVAEARNAGLIDKTLTCYRPVNGKPCGVCPSCKLRIASGG